MMHPAIKTLIESGIGINSICQQCRQKEKNLTKALGPWFTCDQESLSENILFVGKVARGDCLGKELNPFFEDVQDFGREVYSNKFMAILVIYQRNS